MRSFVLFCKCLLLEIAFLLVQNQRDQYLVFEKIVQRFLDAHGPLNTFELLHNKINTQYTHIHNFMLSNVGSPPATPEPECTAEGLPLGMENRKIPTASLSASSIWDRNHGVDRARLNTKAGGGKTG